ncbi:four helix bundle protein [Candidatus Venteria ishoeyi]|uniref:four helix bundle protein n=1 Tax=Candidatus Venteria ishoeyi TaxID=1899563 RepID=UPI0025A5542A|nr:four helix bundle protein [Candidatus Venteria ishoeyi]MDM8544943.1 four helix bundle protein [Candidatus Venteria ishoeyi]
MYQKTSPILRDANRLLVEMEQVVRHFPRYHKYTLGSELRSQVFKINQLIARAWQYKQQTNYYLKRIIRSIDDLKIQLQLAKELQVFRNFAEFQRLAELTISLGKQSGGWLRRLAKRQPEAEQGG